MLEFFPKVDFEKLELLLSFNFQVDLNSKMRAEEKRINDLWDKNRIEMAKKGTLLERAEKRER